MGCRRLGVDKVLFDIDGTLVLLPIDWDKVRAKIKSEQNSELSFLGFVARLHGTDAFWHIHRYLEALELEAVNRLVILDRADKILSELCKRVELGFVTMQSRSAAEKILSKLGIDKCENNLGVLSSRDDAATRVQQVAKALRLMDVNPSKLLFIGDKVLDAIAAILNSVNAILVLRSPVSVRISATDYLDEDLEVLGVRIAYSLGEAIRIAKTVYGLPVDDVT